jgi:hypothetical protein
MAERYRLEGRRVEAERYERMARPGPALIDQLHGSTRFRSARKFCTRISCGASSLVPIDAAGAELALDAVAVGQGGGQAQDGSSHRLSTSITDTSLSCSVTPTNTRSPPKAHPPRTPEGALSAAATARGVPPSAGMT